MTGVGPSCNRSAALSIRRAPRGDRSLQKGGRRYYVTASKAVPLRAPDMGLLLADMQANC